MFYILTEAAANNSTVLSENMLQWAAYFKHHLALLLYPCSLPASSSVLDEDTQEGRAAAN